MCMVFIGLLLDINKFSNITICFGILTNGSNQTTTLPITMQNVFAFATGASRYKEIEAWQCSIQSINSTNIVSYSYTYSQHKYNPHNYILIGKS